MSDCKLVLNVVLKTIPLEAVLIAFIVSEKILVIRKPEKVASSSIVLNIELCYNILDYI